MTIENGPRHDLADDLQDGRDTDPEKMPHAQKSLERQEDIHEDKPIHKEETEQLTRAENELVGSFDAYVESLITVSDLKKKILNLDVEPILRFREINKAARIMSETLGINVTQRSLAAYLDLSNEERSRLFRHIFIKNPGSVWKLIGKDSYSGAELNQAKKEFLDQIGLHDPPEELRRIVLLELLRKDIRDANSFPYLSWIGMELDQKTALEIIKQSVSGYYASSDENTLWDDASKVTRDELEKILKANPGYIKLAGGRIDRNFNLHFIIREKGA